MAITVEAVYENGVLKPKQPLPPLPQRPEIRGSLHTTGAQPLVKRVELQQLRGFTSAHVLADIAHRLMTLEAMQRLNWPPAGLAVRLRKHHAEIPKLTVYRQAIADLPHLLIQALPLTQALVEAATHLSQQHELLTDDALVIAAMQHHGLTSLASEDADFDRVPGITRYAPA